MLNNLLSRITPNAALLVDAAGCFAAAGVLVLSSTVWSWTDLPSGWRQPVLVLLFLFSVLLVVAARYQTRPLFALAILGNIAWIAGGTYALFATGTMLGAIIIGAVMLADAIMARLQAQALRGDHVAARNNTG